MSDDTRDRILALAHEHHYQPSIHARSLRSNRSHTLGLVVPEMTNYGFAVISRELETLCREAGLQLLIACTDENPAQEMMAVNSLVQQQVDGLIVASSQLNDAEYQKINAGLPVVQMDRLIAGSELPLVITDSVNATADTVEKVARQHPDEIYFLGGQPRISPTRDRLAGFQLGPARRRNVQTGMDHQRQLPPQLGLRDVRSAVRTAGASAQSAVHRGLWPAGRGVALSDAASADGERHPPVQLRRSLPVRLHDAEDRYGRARLPGAGAA